MKKIAAIVSVLLVLVLAACSGGSASNSPAASAPAGSQPGNNEGGAAAEWAPTKPIEFVAPAGAGGGWDTTARMVAKVFEEQKIIHQPIGVVNKPGGGGAVGWAYIHSMKDSPYHLFVASPPLLLVPLNGQSEYDYEDFTPIANLIADFAAIAVRADAKWNNLNELFEDMKKDPSSITVVGASSPGSMDHIQFVKVAKAAGVDIKKIKYVSDQEGGGLTQLLNGSVQVYSTGVAETVEQVRAGKIKVLGVTSSKRLEGDVLKDFPTVQEQGIDATFINWRGFFGTPDMDPAAVKYYEAKFKALSESEAWAEICERFGWEPMFMGHEEYKQFLKQENESMKALLDELGLGK